MATCEISGKDVPKTIRVEVEGVVMQVAPEFSHMGKVLDPVANKKPIAKRVVRRPVVEQPVARLVPNYGTVIKRAREQEGLRQQDLAKMMMEKESVIHQVESGHLHPSERLIKKFEHHLHVSLTTTDTNEDVELETEDVGSSLTLGDMLKQAMKK